MAIDHVVVLCLENRSFDHMLGFLDHPDPGFAGLATSGPYDNPGAAGAPSVNATAGAKAVLPFGPDHSHDAVMSQLGVSGRGSQRRCTNQGFVRSYELKARGKSPDPEVGPLAGLLRLLPRKKPAMGTGYGPLIMLCQDPARIPVLGTLALQFAVFDHWFCSVPGETWPNRNYLHAATSDGETDIESRFYEDPTIFELLEKHEKTWHIYHDDTPQVWAFRKLWDTPKRHANWYPSAEFAQHVAAGSLPHYCFIEPNHRPPFHTLDHDPILGGVPDMSTSQHPENNLVTPEGYDSFDDTNADTDFARGERLIATIYEALRANPDVFARTLLLITYDEHGGFYDHVPPPTNVPAPRGRRGPLAQLIYTLQHHRVRNFDFTMLGPRVPAVLVSPLIEAGTVVHDVHDHASVPQTLRHLFAPTAPPLTDRDAWSPRFDGPVTRKNPRADLPDLSEYARPTAGAAPTATAQPHPNGPPGERVPDYYQEFLTQADTVRARLEHVGEPEITAVDRTAKRTRQAIQTTTAFTAAAQRHRDHA